MYLLSDETNKIKQYKISNFLVQTIGYKKSRDIEVLLKTIRLDKCILEFSAVNRHNITKLQKRKVFFLIDCT